MSAPQHFDAIEARVKAGEDELDRLCAGGQWTMRVPANEDRDSDLVFSAVLADARALLARVLDLEERLRTMSAQELDAVSRPAAYAPAARAWGSAYIHDLRACGSVGWFQTPPTDGGCESCESGSLNPADWQPLYVATTAPAEPTDAEVEAAARAMHESLRGEIPTDWESYLPDWDDEDDEYRRVGRVRACAALTAAAAVRAGQAVTA